MVFRAVTSFWRRLKYWAACERIGPDVPLTHWMLHFPGLATRLARRKLLRFGDGSELRPNCYLVETKSISIGNKVVIRPNSMLMASPLAPITIGNDVLIGAGVHMIAANHRFDDADTKISEQGHEFSKGGITIESDVWIGANAMVLAGVTVGTHSVIGAASVVTRDVPAYSMVAGIPAKVIRNLGSDNSVPKGPGS